MLIYLRLVYYIYIENKGTYGGIYKSNGFSLGGSIMKIVSIISSNRKNGNTDRVVRLVEDSLKLLAGREDTSIELERLYIGHMDIKLCRGCRICFDKGEQMCPLKDDLLMVREKIREADGVILASPVYVEDINGVMKNFIDRMAFICHRPEFAGKSAYIITTCGAGSSSHSLDTMSRALHTWGFYLVGANRFRMGAFMDKDEIEKSYHEKTEKIASDIYEAVKYQKAIRPGLYSFIAFKVQQGYWKKTVKYRNTIDYKYWYDKGWLNPGREFYIDHKAPKIKALFGGFIGSIVACFFK